MRKVLIGAAAALLPVALGACGGAGTASDPTNRPSGATVTSAVGTDDPDGADSDGEVEVEVESTGRVVLAPPTFFLTGPVEAPAGWRLEEANCPGNDATGAPYFEYHVPAEWTRYGGGSAGSGGLASIGDDRFETADGPQVIVAVAVDHYDEGIVLDGSGEPWTSWDYVVVTHGADGEEEHHARYEALEQVEIGDELFDLHRLDQGDDEMIGLSEYKLRIVFADVPDLGASDWQSVRSPASATVSVAWDAGDGDLAEAEVREVLSTFRLAECTRDAVMADLEMMLDIYDAEFST